MPDLRECVDLAKVQEGLDLLDLYRERAETLLALHEAQSARFAALLDYLNRTRPASCRDCSTLMGLK